MLGEKNDFSIILKALEEYVTPTSRYIEDCVEYFYMKQGDSSISQFQSKAEQLIERMIPKYQASKSMTHEEVKQLLLRNLLLVAVRHRDVLKEFQKMTNENCTAEKILEFARNAESRENSALRLAKTVGANTRTLPHALQEFSETPVNQIASKSGDATATAQLNPMRLCRWCGGPKLCRRNECPAKDRICAKCQLKGHFAKVCRKSNQQKDRRPSQKRQPVHKIQKTVNQRMMMTSHVCTTSTLCTAFTPWTTTISSHCGYRQRCLHKSTNSVLKLIQVQHAT